MLRTLLLVTCVLTLIGAAAAADGTPPKDAFANAGFKITLAGGASATKQDGPDFTVYFISWGPTGHLGLYEGCCAQTFLAGADLEKADIMINGLKAHQLKRQSGDFVSRELHIDVPAAGGSTHAFVVHAWYKSLGADDAKIADQIIATIAAK